MARRQPRPVGNGWTGGAVWVGFWMPQHGAGGCECAGTITATVTWWPTNGNADADPPPAAAFVREIGTADWTGTSGGACNPGFNDNLVSSTSGPDDFGWSSGTKTATRYSVKENPGSSFQLTCSPTAAATASGMRGGSCSVSWKVEAWPIDIAIGGTTQDPGDSKYKILPGQKMTGSVVYGGDPPITPVMVGSSNVWDTIWSVSGCAPFLDYVRGPADAYGRVTGYSSNVGATTSAWFSAPSTGTDKGSVSCSHKFKVSVAPYTAFTVGLSKDVPVANLTGITADVVAQNIPGPLCQLLGDGYRQLIFKQAFISGKATQPTYFGDPGTWHFTQLITRKSTVATVSGSLQTIQNFVTKHLDNEFVYAAGKTANGDLGETYDTPGFDVSDIPQLSMMQDIQESTMYWVYKPPGTDSKFVSFKSVDWKTGVRAESTTSTPWAAFGILDGAAGCLKIGTHDWPKQPEWELVAHTG